MLKIQTPFRDHCGMDSSNIAFKNMALSNGPWSVNPGFLNFKLTKSEMTTMKNLNKTINPDWAKRILNFPTIEPNEKKLHFFSKIDQ